MDEHLVAPDEVREQKVEPAAFVWDELRAACDLAVDEGQHLSALIVEAERTRRALESLAFDMLQQIEHRRRPCATRAVDRVTGANSDARRLPVGLVAGRDEVDLRLGHRGNGLASLIAVSNRAQRGRLRICCRRDAQRRLRVHLTASSRVN